MNLAAAGFNNFRWNQVKEDQMSFFPSARLINGFQIQLKRNLVVWSDQRPCLFLSFRLLYIKLSLNSSSTRRGLTEAFERVESSMYVNLHGNNYLLLWILSSEATLTTTIIPSNYIMSLAILNLPRLQQKAKNFENLVQEGVSRLLEYMTTPFLLSMSSWVNKENSLVIEQGPFFFFPWKKRFLLI